jgi:hypothetical protein
MGDLFALQDEVTRQIARALDIELVAAEAARPNEHPDALDYILRGRAAMYKPATPDSAAAAISLFERALALDPQSVEAQSLLTVTLVGRVLNGMSDTAKADIKRAEELATEAVAASAEPACAFGQSHSAARPASMRRGHSRIRDGARTQSKLSERLG